MNRIVVVSNRVPAPAAAGAQAGGLAVALEALMERRGGTWFGWSGRVSDDGFVKTVNAGGVDYVTVDLTQDEHDRYYTEYANSTLWPLLHSLPELMTFDRRNAAAYRQVNEKFADGLCPLLRANDLVWVHDYHLFSLPALLRARGVRAPIGFFLHIPFPSSDMLAMAPEVDALVKDVLACDLVGFQTSKDLDNFSSAAVRLGLASVMPDGALMVGGRRVRVGVFPVEIETKAFAEIARTASADAPAERLRRSVAGQKLILGVDRMDPTKGLPQRLAGYRRLLETRPQWHRKVTFLQIAAESRSDVASYRDLRAHIEQDAGSIDSHFCEPDWSPLRLMARAGARNTVAGYMRAARVGLVTPLRDGMNLVAKEYVAAQDPSDPGVLLLSTFAGAAEQLSAALLVNPYDTDQMADMLDQALSMPLAERQERWQACWSAIENHTALGWGRSFVAALLRASLGAEPRYERSRGEVALADIALGKAVKIPRKTRQPYQIT